MSEAIDTAIWGEMVGRIAVMRRRGGEDAQRFAGVFVVQLGRRSVVPGWAISVMPYTTGDDLAVLYRRGGLVATMLTKPDTPVQSEFTVLVSGLRVRRFPYIRQVGDHHLLRVLQHLIAYAAGEMLAPPEPAVNLAEVV